MPNKAPLFSAEIWVSGFLFHSVPKSRAENRSHDGVKNFSDRNFKAYGVEAGFCFYDDSTVLSVDSIAAQPLPSHDLPAQQSRIKTDS